MCGSIIVAEETKIFRTGGGEVRVVFITYKPMDHGIKMHIVCDGGSAIMMIAEIVEGKAMDLIIEYMAEGKFCSTAATLRITKAWADSYRIIVADS